MALPLPERWRAPMGVNAGKTGRDHLVGRALLEVSKDLPIATDIFQSGF